jgi:putative tricarboxylic transport membrane protein
MLTLGIPGSPTAAVLLGGLLIWGLQPGPLLFVEKKDFVWGLIASMYLGNIAGLIIVLTTVPLVGGDPAHPVLDHRADHRRDLRDRRYTVHNNMFDVWMMLVFGVLGYVFKKLKYPSRRWCWRWCWATWPRRASARPCCCPTAASPSLGERPGRHDRVAGAVHPRLAAAVTADRGHSQQKATDPNPRKRGQSGFSPETGSE